MSEYVLLLCCKRVLKMVEVSKMIGRPTVIT